MAKIIQIFFVELNCVIGFFPRAKELTNGALSNKNIILSLELLVILRSTPYNSELTCMTRGKSRNKHVSDKTCR